MIALPTAAWTACGTGLSTPIPARRRIEADTSVHRIVQAVSRSTAIPGWTAPAQGIAPVEARTPKNAPQPASASPKAIVAVARASAARLLIVASSRA